MWNNSLFFLFIFLFQSANFGSVDTLGEVYVQANRYGESAKYLAIQTVDIGQFRSIFNAGETVGALLNVQSAVIGRSYGRGMSNVQSSRGLGARHTLVTLNGQSMNHPMLGVFDINLIPMWFVDDAWIRQGAGSGIHGQNAAGATISLGSKTNTNPAITTGMGSFGQQFYGLKVGISTKKWQSSVKLYRNTSENDFKYYNYFYEDSRQRAFNEQSSHTVETKFVRKENDASTELYLFGTDSQNEIPSQASLPERRQFQSDRIVNAKLSHSRIINDQLFTLGLSSQHFRLNYEQEFPAIDSRSDIQSVLLFGESEFKSSDFTVSLRPSTGLISVSTNNYAETPTRKFVSFAGNGVWKTSFARVYLDARTDFLSDFGTLTSTALGINTPLFDAVNWKLQLSNNQNAPTFNDLYWSPGGNSNLVPETIRAIESGITINSTNDVLGLESTFFSNWQTDGIYWSPEGGVFSPENIEEIRAYGVNTTLKISKRLINSEFIAHFSHSYTRSFFSNERFSGDAAVGKQLRYQPRHIISGALSFRYKKSTLGLTSRSWSEQFVSNDHSSRFDPIEGSQLLDVRFGQKISSQRIIIDIQLSIENVSDTSYQSILWYPQAGRSYLLSLTLQHKKS